MTLLSANLNTVALLRNSRTIGIPSVVRAARIALGAGAHGMTVHPRPDGRHVRAQDVRELAAVLRDRPGAEFNIEGNPFHGLLEFVREVRPAQCTLDRKSTRLNSSHSQISYAVFCLKKKKLTRIAMNPNSKLLQMKKAHNPTSDSRS